MRSYILKNICSCSKQQQLDVLSIRNSQTVRQSMYTDHIIPEAEHFAWIRRLENDPKNTVFAILKEGTQAVGVVSINQTDRLHKKTDWAFYLDAGERGGVGSALESFMLDWVFFDLGMEKLNCEVLETNPVVIAMHKKFGFTDEGLRRKNILRDGERVDVHLLGITDEEWKTVRQDRLDAIRDKIQDIRLTLEP